LSAAWHLAENAPNTNVVLFEASDRLGGHAYTVPVTLDDGSTVDVDIGFMVFNDANYPNMVKWFDSLADESTSTGVPREDTDMSLSVSLDGGETLEWTSNNGLNGFLAKRGQLFDSRFRSMVKDMTRFHAEAPKLLLLPDEDPRKHVTTQQYLKQNGYSNGFAVYYLLPMMAALWSASMEDVLNFPAAQLIGFLCNHKMLQLFGRPQVSRNFEEKKISIEEKIGRSHDFFLSTNVFFLCSQFTIFSVCFEFDHYHRSGRRSRDVPKPT
jgi:cyclopropane-fatty-acyl-phospholipid synthase